MWIRRGFAVLLLVVALIIDSTIGVPAGRRKPKPPRDNDCKFIINIGQGPDGQSMVSSVQMPSLKTMMNGGADGDASTTSTHNMNGANVCNLVFAVEPTVVLADGQKRPLGTQVITAGYPTTKRPTDITTAKIPIGSSSTVAGPTGITTTKGPFGYPTTEVPFGDTTTKGPNVYKTMKGSAIYTTQKRPTGFTTTEGPSKVSVSWTSSEESHESDELKNIYEHQMSVWPTDMHDIVDVVQSAEEDEKEQTMGIPLYEEQDVVYPEGQVGDWSTSAHVIPLYEDQMVIFPEAQFDEEGDNFPSFVDESLEEEEDDMWPTEEPQKPVGGQAIKVIEKYHIVHPNGTIEYKLSFSNGAVDYKKIYPKLVDGKVITVQEGYNSVPVQGHPNEFQTEFYIADERGHNVYKVEHNRHRPELPTFLSYTDQMKAAGIKVV